MDSSRRSSRHSDTLKRIRAGSAYSTFHGLKEVAERKEDAALMAHIERSKAKLSQLRRQSSVLRVQQQQQQLKLHDAEQKVKELRHQVELLSQPDVAPSYRRQLWPRRRQLTAMEQDIKQLAAVLETTKQDFNAVEKEKDDMEVDMLRLLREEQRLLQKEEQADRQERAVAQRTARRAERAAIARERKAEAKKAREEAEYLADLQRQQELELTAKRENAKARRKLREEQALDRVRKAQFEKQKAVVDQRRVQAILQLKHNVDKAHASIAASNEKRARLLVQKEARRARERQELLAAGQNPDAVFGAREERAKIRRKKARLKAKVKQSEMKLLDRLAEEDERNRKRQVAQQRKDAVVTQYVKSLGRSFRERKTEEFLKSRTKGGKDIVDPTGRTFKIHPSRVTVIKDNRFGTGHADPDVVTMLTRRHPKVTFNETLLQTRPRSSTSPDIGHSSGSDDEDSEQDELQLGMDVPLDRSARRIAPQRQPTVFEKKRAAMRAKEQQARLEQGQAKTVCGKTYKSKYFLAEPAKIVFKDFQVGKPMKKKVALTNVSFTFNTFKVLPLSNELAEFIEVEYVPKGRMSAGITAHITVHFTPKVNADLHGAVQLMAETGPFSIPIDCFTRKAHVVVQPALLNLGNVLRGESATQMVTLVNRGALAVPFYARFDDKHEAVGHSRNGTATDLLLDVTDDQDSAKPNDTTHSATNDNGALEEAKSFARQSFSFPTAGMLAGYSSVQIPVAFRPPRRPPGSSSSSGADAMSAVDARATLRFQFGAASASAEDQNKQRVAEKRGDLQWDSAKEFVVTAQATAVDVPVYVQEKLLDLQCCLFGRLYRSTLHVRNRGGSAMKVEVRVPQPLRGVLELAPAVGYVQACGGVADALSTTTKGKEVNASVEDGSFPIQVTFHPRSSATSLRELLAVVRKWREGHQHVIDAAERADVGKMGDAAEDAENGIVDIPIQVQVAEQKLPVYFRFRAQVVDCALQLSHKSVDFGGCYTTQSVAVPLTITNPSPIVQKVVAQQRAAKGAAAGVLSVQPGNGFMTLLPHSTVTREIVFAPTVATHQKMQLVLATQFGDEYHISCKGVGVTPPLQLSHACLGFPALGEGESLSLFVTLSNPANARKAQAFEFQVPGYDLPPDAPGPSTPPPTSSTSDAKADDNKDATSPPPPAAGSPSNSLSAQSLLLQSLYSSYLTVQPCVGLLNPGESARVEFTFAPSVVSTFQSLYAEQQSAKKAAQAAEAARLAAEEEQQSKGKKGNKKETKEKKKKKTKKNAQEEEEEDAQTQDDTDVSDSLPPVWPVAPAHGDVQVQFTAGAEAKLPFADALPPDALLATNDPMLAGRALAQLASQEWGRRAVHRVKCCVRGVSVRAGKANLASLASAKPTDTQLMFVEVTTSMVAPRVSVVPQRLDFGQVVTQNNKVLPLKINNLTDETLSLSCAPLSLTSPYLLLNAQRPIPPRGSSTIMVEFKPEVERPFTEHLRLAVGNAEVVVEVRGTGMQPKITIEPSTVDFGHLLVGDMQKHTLKMTNSSPFPFSFALVDHSERGKGTSSAHDAPSWTPRQEFNVGGLHAFGLSPSRGTLAAGETVDLVCSFSPDHASDFFHATFKSVSLPLTVHARGSCHERQLYLAQPRSSGSVPPSSASFSSSSSSNSSSSSPSSKHLQDPLSFLTTARSSATTGHNEQDITVTFADKAGVSSAGQGSAEEEQKGVLVADLVVGSCTVHDPKTGKASASKGSYQFTLEDPTGCFKVEPLSGALNTGDSVQVKCRFDEGRYRDNAKGSVMGSIGQWVSCKATCSLKGGVVPSGAPADHDVTVLLRSFVAPK